MAKGEFVLIFDADFVAPPDVLEKTVGQFTDPRVGMVQTRWGHINRDYSLLTQVQSVLLDGHFILEHGGRNRSGRFFNFNGTAGLWRRAAIDDAGGWQHDTLTEDLDLSYRAQMKGWRFVYLQDVVCPAEIPVEMNAFKSQQHRWAKGSIQTCQKLLPRILASDLPLHVKVESAFHLTANFAYPLMVLLSLLMFPAMVIRYNMGLYEMLIVDVPLFMGATMSVCSLLPDRARGRSSAATGRAASSTCPRCWRWASASASTTPRPSWRRSSAWTRASRARPSTGSRARATSGRQKRYKGALDFLPFRRAGARPLLRRDGLVRPHQRHLGHPALHPDLPGGLPLRGGRCRSSRTW